MDSYLNLMLKAVSGYAPGEPVSDLVWQERNRGSNSGRSTRRESNVTPIESVRAAAASRTDGR